jgi:lipopolysaccharide/colanic/teichoic acid biosynthesis glycosyltransferase
MLKRFVDITVSLVTLIALSPILCIIALFVAKNLKGAVIFRQVRPGLGGEHFTMLKFRTMLDGIDSEGKELPDAKRLTKFGRFLRSTSLDELPELWNVLKGDMSLVGPRPLLLRYYQYYTKIERARHNVRPGITGWAQVNGRNNLGWDERLKMDVWYVENISLWLDIKILFMTLVQVIRGKDIVVDAQSVMLNLDEERSKEV